MDLERKLKNQEGITLVALTVTIIVLLVLVGTPIIMLSGDSSIIDFAFKAKKVTDVSKIEEVVKNATLAASADGKGIIKQNPLERELEIYMGKKGIEYTLTGDETEGWTVIVPQEQLAFEINSDGDIKLQELIDNSGSYALALIDDLGTRSTIYLYGNPSNQVTGTISTSLKESPTGSNVETTTTDITTPSYESNLTSNANYVTYTVNKNGIYTFDITANGETTETKVRINNIEQFTKIDDMGLNYAGNDQKAYKYKGAAVPKGYYVDTNSNVETGLVITDAVDAEGYSLGNEWVWVPVNPIVGNDDYYLTGEGIMAGTETVGYTKYSKLWSFTTNSSTGVTTRNDIATPQEQPSDTTGNREPAILTNASHGEVKKFNLINSRTTGNKFTNVTDVAEQYVTDYNNMVASVETYQGFYIGRYEITSNGEMPGIPHSANWYTFYNQCLTYGTDYTESGMIYGCLWDATMRMACQIQLLGWKFRTKLLWIWKL